jgi:hypothetical protein
METTDDYTERNGIYENMHVNQILRGNGGKYGFRQCFREYPNKRGQ